jgi:two-component system OmpR family response regulator
LVVEIAIGGQFAPARRRVLISTVSSRALTDAGYVVIAPSMVRALHGDEPWMPSYSTSPAKMDISILEAWRRNGRSMPVLISARPLGDKVQGFDAGADDCCQAFPRRVLARIRALLRRSTVRPVESPVAR